MKRFIALVLFMADVCVGCANLQTPAPVQREDPGDWAKSSAVQPIAVQVNGEDGKTATKIQYLPLEYSQTTRQFRVYVEPTKPAAADVKKIEPKVPPKPEVVAPKQ